MSQDNVFTLFLKGIFVLILIILALALILPFLNSVIFSLIDFEIILTIGIFIFLGVVLGSAVFFAFYLSKKK